MKIPLLTRVKLTLALVFFLTVKYAHSQSNYQYDDYGRLVADLAEDIASIEWNNQNKVTKVTHTPNSLDADLEIIYDALGNRSIKIVKPRNGNGVEPEHTWKYTFYEYDLNGSSISTYTKFYEVVNQNTYQERIQIQDYGIYANYRIGLDASFKEIISRTFNADLDASGKFINIQEKGYLTPPLSDAFDIRGEKQYQLTNHLQDVTTVVGDRRIMEQNLTTISFKSSVQSAQDYYAYGMTMPERKEVFQSYRYGYNGKEKDNEVKGDDNAYDFQGRSIYDPRLGRFNSVDPLWRSFPDNSPYHYGANNPIFFIDKNGENKEAWAFYWTKHQTQRLKEIRDDVTSFKAKNLIDSNTDFKTGFMYGVIDQAIAELTALNPMELADAAVGLYELAGALYNDPTLAGELFDAITNSAGEFYDEATGEYGPGRMGYAHGEGATAVASLFTPVAIAKLGKASKTVGGLKKSINLMKKNTARKAIIAASCFLGDTEVLIAGGKQVYIKDISVEKEVYQLSEEDKKMLRENKVDFYIEIQLKDQKYLVANDQYFIVDDTWVKAEELIKGDKILKVDGTSVEVLSIQKIQIEDLDRLAEMSSE